MMYTTIEKTQKPILGISGCVTGLNIRFNGTNKHNRYCTTTLAELFDFEPYCPEVQSGMATPRPTIRLVEHNDSARAFTTDIFSDVSKQLEDIFYQNKDRIAQLSGFILTHKSPSCGLYRVKTYNPAGNVINHSGRGIFAKALTEYFPELPVEEAERLNDPSLRENFLLRIFAYFDWQQLTAQQVEKAEIIDFYTRYKYLMLSHSPVHYKKIGALLSNIKEYPLNDLKAEFIYLFMSGLSHVADRGKHTNTLLHLLGYFKNYLSKLEKRELIQLIHAYHNGQIPLIAPITLFKHHLVNYKITYLQKQKYFDPYPYHLGLRNNIQGTN